jgi:pyruvate dehydrogenase E2 component (dihydrolipoamide acetyltransferase)
MAKKLNLPKLSPTMEDGVLAIWHKKEGDSFKTDDLLAEVETDKATMEFRAFDSGVILKLLVKEGSTVKLGEVLAITGDAGEVYAEEVSSQKQEEKPITLEKVDETPKKDLNESAHFILTRTDKIPEFIDEIVPIGNVLASPAIRSMARKKDIDLTKIKGSGPNGRLIMSDLDINQTIKIEKNIVIEDTSFEKVKLSQMRKTIARRLTESKSTVPHFYLTISINCDALTNMRNKLQTDFSSKFSVNDFIILAASKALAKHPDCNVSWDDGDNYIQHKNINVSVAVAIPGGLVTPVIKDSDKSTISEINSEVKRLASLAKDKKLSPDQMSGGTFSISNLGSYGVEEFSAVINPPEGFILAVGSIVDNKMKITMSCDHRVIDGAVGANYLKTLKNYLENPMLILI